MSGLSVGRQVYPVVDEQVGWLEEEGLALGEIFAYLSTRRFSLEEV